MLEDTENSSVYEVSELINSTLKYVPNVGYDSDTAFFWNTKKVFTVGDTPEPSVVIVVCVCAVILPTKLNAPLVTAYNLSPVLTISSRSKAKDKTLPDLDEKLPTP
jgi:hypothetical protein